MNDKTLMNLSGAILECFLASFYLNEVKHTKVFKQSLKLALNNAQKELLLVEKNYFNGIDEIDEGQMSDKLVANKMAFIDYLVNRYSYDDFSFIQEILLAYDKNPKEMKKFSDEIIIDNGSKKQNYDSKRKSLRPCKYILQCKK